MQIKKIILSIVLGIALIFSSGGSNLIAAPGNNPGNGPVQFVDVLIGYENSPRFTDYSFIKSQGGIVKKEISQINLLWVSLPEHVAQRALTAWSQRPNISYIEEDGEMHALGQTIPWGIERIEAPATHSTSTGGGIKVAILDTGIDVRHEDLKVAGGYAVHKCRGRCAADYDDDHGHGTHVAGTVAAIDNDLGVLGVAPAVDLYAVKVLNQMGSSVSYTNVVEGIIWAADNDMNIINMSIGSTSYPEAIHDAVKYAHGEGVLSVAAAGNNGDWETVDPVYPAAYPEVMAIGAVEQKDGDNDECDDVVIAEFSNHTSGVDLVAPGVDVLSTYPGNRYTEGTGTSMATPHVAGAAALVWSANPDLTNDEVRTILQENAEELGFGSDYQGKGLVRADLAVSAAGDFEPPATGDIEGTVKDESEVAIKGATVVVEGTNLSAITDEDGYYLLENVPVGTYDVTASADGYHSETAEVTVEEDERVTQNFTLEAIPTYTISGTVKDTENNLLYGATVTIEETGQSATTDEYGSYEITNVEEGTYDITASKSSYTSQTKHVNVESDATVDFVLKEDVEDPDPEPGDLSIDRFDITVTSNPAWARVGVEWTVSGTNLASVKTEMKLGETIIDSQTSSISGSSASGTHDLRNRNGHGKTYDIILTVTDTDGKSLSKTQDISL